VRYVTRREAGRTIILEPRSNAQIQADFRRRRRLSQAARQAAKGPVPLPAIATIPGWRRWRQLLTKVEEALSQVHEQMQTYHDERSDN
jgi:hypothetical protein